ncbi:UNVERIFIED_CONTAM: hypothetical protein FKN15_030190 [Acipenser sinensis]
MDRNALAELLQALESRRDAEERRREERYTALIERTKVEVLKAVDNAPPYKKKKDVAVDFNIPTNTFSTILNNWDTKIQA